jgi:cupin 2 domain-containing protein
LSVHCDRQKTIEEAIMIARNLLDDIPGLLPDELHATILRADGVRVERIVSEGQASPPGFWYDQDDDEWVMVFEGNAGLQFEGAAEPVELRAGSFLNIPAHARHRVAWTDPHRKTVWLAIHYRGGIGRSAAPIQ